MEQERTHMAGRGLHSSTFQLNSSAFCRTGVHPGIVQGLFYEVSGGIKEHQGVFTVYFVSETAQVELRSGRLYAPNGRQDARGNTWDVTPR